MLVRSGRISLQEKRPLLVGKIQLAVRFLRFPRRDRTPVVLEDRDDFKVFVAED